MHRAAPKLHGSDRTVYATNSNNSEIFLFILILNRSEVREGTLIGFHESRIVAPV